MGSKPGKVTIDSKWRWTHATGQTNNCYTGNAWDKSLCPDAKTCTSNCVIEGAGAEYENTYGVKASGDKLTLGFVTQGPYSRNVGSRNYLMDSESTYKLFKLKNKEFTYTVMIPTSIVDSMVRSILFRWRLMVAPPSMDMLVPSMVWVTVMLNAQVI